MRTLILSVFTILSLTSFAQRFETEADVLLFLDGKKFRNSEVNVSVIFFEQGTQLKVNDIVCYSPDIIVVSETKAVCTYYRISNPEQKVVGIINSKDKTWTDRINGRVYKLVEW